MTSPSESTAPEKLTMAVVQEFIDTYDPRDPQDRLIRTQLLAQLHCEMHRRDREWYPEWVDHGGES